MKRIIVTSVAVLVLLATAAACFGETKAGAGEQKLQKIVVAEAARGELWLPVYLANGLGYFKDEGLDVNFVTYQGAMGTSALLSGDAQFATLGYEMVLKLADKGKSTKMILATTNRHPYSLVVNGSVKHLSDLKGKKISSAPVGTSPYAFVRACVKSGGLNPNKDVTYVDLPTASIIGAMEKGDVDATFAYGSFKNQLRKRGYQVLVDLSEPAQHNKVLGTPTYEVYVVQTTDQTIKEHPETVQKFVNAVVRAMTWQKNHKPEEAADKVAPLFTQRDRATLIENIADSKKVYTYDGHFSKKGHEAAVQLSLEAGMIGKAVPMTDIVDETFLNKAWKQNGSKKSK